MTVVDKKSGRENPAQSHRPQHHAFAEYCCHRGGAWWVRFRTQGTFPEKPVGVGHARWSSSLLHSNPSIRDATLRKMRNAGHETEELLLDCMVHSDPQCRVFAACEIRREIPFSTDSLSALQKALSDDDFRVRAMAAESIGIVVRRSIGRLHAGPSRADARD